MKYLYQQLLAFWSLIILTVVLIGISFTSINKRTLVNQNYNQIRE
ncbi:sensor histidine kinase [Enterococcus faecium]|nr:sensor histidine kinase [Enterococcus faecium]